MMVGNNAVLIYKEKRDIKEYGKEHIKD